MNSRPVLTTPFATRGDLPSAQFVPVIEFSEFRLEELFVETAVFVVEMYSLSKHSEKYDDILNSKNLVLQILYL